MKKNLLIVITLFITSIGYSQNEKPSIVEPDLAKFRAAANWSKNGEGIGLFLIAGKQYDSLTDSQIQSRFDKYLLGSKVKIKVIIQRTDLRNGSTHTMFYAGHPCGDVAGATELKNLTQRCVNSYRIHYGIEKPN